jgi:hypothetical protein
MTPEVLTFLLSKPRSLRRAHTYNLVVFQALADGLDELWGSKPEGVMVIILQQLFGKQRNEAATANGFPSVQHK